MSDLFLDAILEYKNQSIAFNLIFDDMITYHNLNLVEGIQISIGYGNPRMLEEIGIPDFTYYIKCLLPHFMKYEIQSITFSYGEKSNLNIFCGCSCLESSTIFIEEIFELTKTIFYEN